MLVPQRINHCKFMNSVLDTESSKRRNSCSVIHWRAQKRQHINDYANQPPDVNAVQVWIVFIIFVNLISNIFKNIFVDRIILDARWKDQTFNLSEEGAKGWVSTENLSCSIISILHFHFSLLHMLFLSKKQFTPTLCLNKVYSTLNW